MNWKCMESSPKRFPVVLFDRRSAPSGTGTGEAAWGTKFVLVAARSGDERGRIIIDVEWVPEPGSEARHAMNSFERVAPHLPGAQGVIYDTALRGVHHQKLLREFGWLPINKATAAVKGSRRPRRKDGQRVEKNVHVEDKQIRLEDGSARTCRLYASGGALGLGELTDTGEVEFLELERNALIATRTRAGSTVGTTTTVYLPATVVERSRCVCTATTRTRYGASTVPRTCGPSHRRPQFLRALFAAQRLRVDQPRPR